MHLLLHLFLFLIAICLCKAGYGHGYYGHENDTPQSDVDAPAYVPSYLKHLKFTKSGARGSHYGTKTGYSGTKSGYSGTKSGYSGTKSGYHGTKSYTGAKSWPTNTGEAPKYDDFRNSANQPYTPACNPPCQNEGICVDGTTCHCSPDYRGNYCEFRKVPCLTHPPLPANSERKCSAEFCTITCAAGHRFPDGSTVTNMRCADGQWAMTRADLSGLSDCFPVCEPACLHGGVCLSANQCQCPPDRRGPQCQYSSSACDATKLGFNGGYKCHGDGETFSCALSCPAGMSFNHPPAHEFTCLYSTGVFEPQPLPLCIVEKVEIVTPSNYHHAHEVLEVTQSHANGTQVLPPASQVLVEDLSPKAGTCLAWAGTHYKTFDGKIYSFKSPCQHVLLRDEDRTLTVALRHRECKGRSSCPAELTFFIGDKEYVLAVDDEGTVIFRSSRRLIPVPARLPGVAVTQRGSGVTVTLLAATLLWDTDNVILIEASPLLWNKTAGLCGTLDGAGDNEFRLQSGSAAGSRTAFAADWQSTRIGETCDSTPSDANSCVGKSEDVKKQAKQFCTKLFTHSKFRKCSSVMDVLSLLETCQWDYCSGSETLSSEESACATVAVYAKECLRQGVEEIKNWRDADTCPMQCPEGKIYKACGPESQPSCAFPETPAKPSDGSCVEGCFCPPGLLLEGGKCLPKDQCPCRLRNRNFEPGATVSKDCNSCKCQAGEWTCTKEPCGARCGAVGDPHYTTFDGLRFDFMGRCNYVLLQTENVTVEAENLACSYSEQPIHSAAEAVGKPSCTRSVTVRTEGVAIALKQAGVIVVNGKELTSLPVTVGKVLIRTASSLFVIVQLPSGIDVWWDGKSRTYVDVPADFNNNTKGLCGTFNLNQKDDFLTSEGDVEQSAFAFANKWKTREACTDISTKEPEHPCEANVGNKEAAQKYCSYLKSKLFESCHWYVDVTPFHEACLYDMCACAGDASRCLCAVLGDYADRCAAAGAHVQWRYNVKECELSCTGGQEYSVCADSCGRTCVDVALATERRCRPSCVEGCACVAGQVLDENNLCVPVAQCPCHHKGMEFKTGYKEVRAGRRERNLCTCVGAHWDCVPATDSDVQKFPPAEDLRSNCSAARHMEFTTCATEEPVTCKNMHLAQAPPAAECRPGCRCRAGYVADVTSQRCVKPADCPCHHGGRSYADGEAVAEECNTCTCKSGNWTCTSRPCVGTCSAWGDSHVVTYDGAQYDFEGVCSYLLAKGCMEAGQDGFQVDIQNVPCGTTGATCSKSVSLKVGGGGAEEIVELTKDAPLPDVSSLTRIKLRQAGAFVFLDVPSLGVTLQWDRGMRVYVRVDAMWKNRVKGLCGNFNGDLRDDFQTPSGGDLAEASALLFADSWKLQPTCPKTQAVKDHCQQRPERHAWAVSTCGAMKRHPFAPCHTEVPPGPFVERCERDACACDSGGDCACACAALATYAQLCAARGVVVKWRTQELCPMQCDEECSNYDACMSPCPAETCDNTLYYAEIKTSCAKDACVEGCKPKTACPEDSVYANATAKDCVPRATCKPVCMQVDGRVVLEGELLAADACHSCICSRGQRVCTGLPCSTEPTPLTDRPPTAPNPNDEQLKCLTGWSGWVSQGVPATNALAESVEAEPLPEAKRFPIGTPMCKPSKMQKIECRTVADHRPSKDTGLDVECSLERGLLCKETDGKTCADFEIRVFCQCDDEPFQCLNSTRPNHPHPTNCNQFYECTPEGPADSAHAVLKSCSEGLMYNPDTMVCDWPAAVELLRPECRNTTEQITEVYTGTTPTVFTWATATLPVTTPRACPAGQVYAECAFPCDKLCDHFKKTVLAKGLCTPGKKCIEGCVAVAVAKGECGGLWRDENTCVRVEDCTCSSNNGSIVKPGGVTSDGCTKCQCLDNALHCDSSDCETTVAPETTRMATEMTTEPTTAAPTHPTSVVTPTYPSTVVVATKGPPTTAAPLVIVTGTTSPPPQCPENRYIHLLEDLPDSAYSSSSVVNDLFAPQYARLNAHPLDINAGSWNPSAQDQNQYIQVAFDRREPLYGVLMQGSPLFDQYVTSYELMYGDQPGVFETLKDADGQPRILRGPIDKDNAVKQMFNPPIEAKYVRIRPMTWHDEISVRFDLIGCQEDVTTTAATIKPPTTVVMTTQPPMKCTDQLGLGAGLPVDNIEVSSNSDKRNLFSFDGERGWTPLYSTPGEWIMFDFQAPRQITGVKTKGGPSGWVTAYQIMYTSDLSTFSPVLDKDGAPENFAANYDAESVALIQFQLPIHARYFKVLPVKWHNAIEMRIEPIGCFEPYLTPATSAPGPASTTTEGGCALCPDALAPSDGACPCQAKEFYDGENCVPRDQCPCFVGFMSYAVGASFRGTNCDECVCKLGGVTNCKPVTECKCSPDLVPKQSPDTCKCECEPCPAGTRICPSSKLCLALGRWCDGLQDCPDDEVGCTTVGPTTTLEPLVVTTQAPTVVAVATTPKPKVECPKVECPRGYSVAFISGEATKHRHTGSDLPPPRPRLSYQSYYKGGKGGRKGHGGYKGAKGKFAKGGYSAYQPPKINQAFTLDTPTLEEPKAQVEECRQFKCIPKLPPYRPGVRPPPCAAPLCPPHYSLKLEAVATKGDCPQYVCVPPPERPVYCNVTGRTISTFDGAEYKYDVCDHTLARDFRLGAWTVIVRKKCTVAECRNVLLIRQDDQEILIKPNLMIEYNNYEYSVEQTSLICFQKNSFDLDKLGDGLVVTSRKYNFTVLFNGEGDVKIGVYKHYLNSVDGLCGFYDGDSSNDRRLPGGARAASVETFGDAWAKPGAVCPNRVVPLDKQRKTWELCGVIAQEPLSRCGKVLNLDKWRNICLEKVCECTELLVNGTRRTDQQCRCLVLEHFVAECLAADKDIELDWRTLMDCPAECPGPLVHYDCYRRACEPQCSTLGVGRRCQGQPGQCTPGCFCPEGKLRQGNACVAPQDCLDCACSSAGMKFTTFERDELPLGGNCTYLASTDRNDTGHHAYRVYATNGPCGDGGTAICTKAVHLIHDEQNVIRVEPNPATKKLQVTIDGAVVFDYPASKDWVIVRELNGQDVVIALTGAHVALRVQPSLEFEVRAPSHLYANATQGLCGVCAGYQDRLLAHNGSLTDDLDEYSQSYLATGDDILKKLDVHPQKECGGPDDVKECVPPPPEKNPCYNILNVEKFGPCHALLEPQSFLETCEAELCAGAGDACAALQRYAAACRRQGVCLDWRARDLCPHQQCESPLVYRPCVGCELTCDNYDETSDVSCDKQLVEGCYCPEGKVRVNNTCIEPAKCFPCDANMEHYAGQEWQQDACTKCTCSKVPKENAAHVACTTQTCIEPVCSEHEDLKTWPAKPGACCQEYQCVAQPKHTETCEELKQIVCGFGQVLKLKTKPDGCPEYTCECKPASECEPLPKAAPAQGDGMETFTDDSGCCPRLASRCRPDTCPPLPRCGPARSLKTTNTTGCCPQHECVLAKDKCLVTLEWEASMKGGEVARQTPEEVAKDLDEVWQDGPCRSCRCAAGGERAAPACLALQCSVPAAEQYVLQARALPLACCPQHVRAACRVGDKVYQPGETWQSDEEPCKSFECKQLDGDLELVTNVQTCHADCQPGWRYVPAGGGACCGRCEAAGCAGPGGPGGPGGAERPLGARWSSPDACVNYTCVLVNGTLQVQSANETCPTISEAMEKEFVMSEVTVPGKCCKTREPLACRVGDQIYQEGQTWPTSDPCVNVTCARDAGGRLARAARAQACPAPCARGWRLAAPAAGRCCGDCQPVACIQGDEEKPIGATWHSADNCTTYSCARADDGVLVTSSSETCPRVDHCAPHLLYTEGCCRRCKLEKADQKPERCKPESLPDEESVGIVRLRRRERGLCVNARPLPHFKECRGACVSGTLFNNHTGSHDSSCECCQVTKYEPLEVTLTCEDGTSLQHQVASPVHCDCRACGEAGGLLSRPSGTKTGHANKYGEYVEIPDMYRRFGEHDKN